MAGAEIAVHPNQTVRISSPFGFPLREDIAFTDVDGVERPSARKRQKSAIEKLQEPVRKILEPGEVLLYFARAQIMPGKLQRYTQGTQSRYLAPAVLILTNRRLLHLSLKWNGRWNRSVRSALWGDIKQAVVAGHFRGKLYIEYRQGWKETYWRIPSPAAKKIKFLLSILLSAQNAETTAARAMASLCPDCLAVLTPRVYQCGGCGLKFRSEKMLLPHALLLPGGAYFHAGLDLFGAAHAFVDIAIVTSMTIWGLAIVGKVHPHIAAGVPPTRTTYALVTIFLATVLIFDLCMGIRIARNAIRNFIPKP